jgi:hypothetical protein
VWLLGPLVKANGFATMLVVMAGISALSALAVLWLPGDARLRRAAAALQSAPDPDAQDHGPLPAGG